MTRILIIDGDCEWVYSLEGKRLRPERGRFMPFMAWVELDETLSESQIQAAVEGAWRRHSARDGSVPLSITVRRGLMPYPDGTSRG